MNTVTFSLPQYPTTTNILHFFLCELRVLCGKLTL